MDEYQRTGYIEPYEKEYLRKDGERFWGLFAGKRLETTGDGVALIVDITERKRREANLALIAELASTLAGAYDVSGVMHVAGEKLAHLLDIERCYFVRIDETRDDVLVTAQWSAPGQNPLPLSMRISELPSEAVLEPADERRTFIRAMKAHTSGRPVAKTKARSTRPKVIPRNAGGIRAPLRLDF